MCDCFGNREIEIEEEASPHARPVKSYRFVRPSSTKSNSIPFDTVVYHSSSRLQPRKDTFQPAEGDDSKAKNTPLYQPLPAVIHQPFQHAQPIYQQPLQHPQPDIFEPFPPPPPAFHANLPAQHRNLRPGFSTPERIGWADNDNGTIIVDDSPQYAVARLPRRDSHGRSLVVRGHRAGHHGRPASRTRRAWNNRHRRESDGNGPNWEWDDGDSWSGRDDETVKSGYWSDGGDSFNEPANVKHTRRVGRRIGDGRRDGGRGYYLT
jgi:hypothetical protein